MGPNRSPCVTVTVKLYLFRLKTIEPTRLCGRIHKLVCRSVAAAAHFLQAAGSEGPRLGPCLALSGLNFLFVHFPKLGRG